MSETCEFEGLEQANDVLGLLMRHWNGIATTLHEGGVHVPLLQEDENGLCPGNDWSRGFMRGMNMRKEAWAEIFSDDEPWGWMLPVLMLYHEHDKDPELRSGPIEPDKREEIIIHMAAGIVRAYRYFQRQPQREAAQTHSRSSKIGRNDECPCGSGKKYKRCCGRANKQLSFRRPLQVGEVAHLEVRQRDATFSDGGSTTPRCRCAVAEKRINEQLTCRDCGAYPDQKASVP